MMWRHTAAALRTTFCKWRTFIRGHHCGVLSSKADHIRLSDEVEAALQGHLPVVALESTIITHGMPYPHNLRTAQMVEEVVRQNGAVPATIAILKGKIHIGLTSTELESLATDDSGAIKTSRRDMPYVLSQRLTGGTTVSGTMIAAHMVGIPVFVTGGIGGVHRGAESTMDVSADLTELGRTPIAVVSAGIKSILDIGRTLEYLETEGVCITTFGPAREFPAFFTPKSGFQSPYNVESPTEAAKLIDTSLSLSLGSGVLVAVPIPEEEATAGAEIEIAIQTAVKESEEKGVSGKEVTPFILARVNELTEGRSLSSNIALIRNNAKVGSQIAVELAKLKEEVSPKQSAAGSKTTIQAPRSSTVKDETSRHSRPVVVGGINVDFTARVKVAKPQHNGATYPGDVSQTFGGVGRNIASCLSRLDNNPIFLSAMGEDNYSEYFLQQARHLDLSRVRIHPGVKSAVYCAILEADGELLYGLGDFDIHNKITPVFIKEHEEDMAQASIVFMDGNIPTETIAYITDLCYNSNVPVWFEPTDLHHSSKPIANGAYKKLSYISPNLNELRIIHGGITKGHTVITTGSNPDRGLGETLEEATRLVQPLIESIPNVLVTLGQYGAMLATKDRACYCSARPRHAFPPRIASVSGAGDCLAAGFISSLLAGSSPQMALKAGILASQHSLQSQHAVPVSMTPEVISATAIQQLDPWEIEERVL